MNIKALTDKQINDIISSIWFPDSIGQRDFVNNQECLEELCENIFSNSEKIYNNISVIRCSRNKSGWNSAVNSGILNVCGISTKNKNAKKSLCIAFIHFFKLFVLEIESRIESETKDIEYLKLQQKNNEYNEYDEYNNDINHKIRMSENYLNKYKPMYDIVLPIKLEIEKIARIFDK